MKRAIHMDSSDIQQHLLRNRSLRVGSQMAAYILKHAPLADSLPIIAHDARTGLPLASALSPADMPLPSSDFHLLASDFSST
jgi:hypothetical protein